jgi:hypothetical protein
MPGCNGLRGFNQYDVRAGKKVSYNQRDTWVFQANEAEQAAWRAGIDNERRGPGCAEMKSAANCAQEAALEWLTLFVVASTVNVSEMSVRKIQIGQLWRKNDTGDVYLVTRVYSEALSTIVVLRKSGAEDEALTRLRAENTPKGPGIPGYSPAQDEEKF